MVAALLAAVAMAGTPATYTYRSLANPTSGDQFGFRAAIQQNAQTMSDRLFAALASVLGGQAPTLNFVPQGSPLTPGDLSANYIAFPGGPVGTVNVDPLAVEGMTNFNSPYHNATVYAFPHEMAHLRQTAQVLADLATREGGAQAFSDLVTPVAAQRAHIPLSLSQTYDGAYAQYVKDAQARGNDWITGTQFGHAAVPWP